MRLSFTLLSAFIVAIVVSGQPSASLDMQERGQQHHLIQARSAGAHSLTSAGSRMIHKRGSSGRKCKSKANKTASSSHSNSQSSSDKTSESNNDQSSGKTKSSGSSKGDDIKHSIGKGLQGLHFKGNCKNPKADAEFPNGHISFLNCGLSKSNPSSKWTPPTVHIDEIKTISADKAASASIFSPCRKFKSDFERAEKATGIPAVMLMSFAMQESTCNPSVTGGGGERGMLQLTPDKCANANCYDAGTNIMMGAKYFKSEVDRFGGNVLEALGAYNGWSSSMTFASATSQQYGCHSQNNLDYANSMLNGFFMGKDGHDKKFRIYDNLASCGK